MWKPKYFTCLECDVWKASLYHFRSLYKASVITILKDQLAYISHVDPEEKFTSHLFISQKAFSRAVGCHQLLFAQGIHSA